MRLSPAILIFILTLLNVGADTEDADPDHDDDLYPTIFVALLLSNKAHTLPHFFRLFRDLHYPKDRLALFIRSDHNGDLTGDIIHKWIHTHQQDYHLVNVSVTDAQEFYPNDVGPLAWTDERFRHVMTLKEEALEEARRVWADFVWFLDGDVFITNPDTLSHLVSLEFTISAPMLKSLGLYSNFWAGMTETFYYKRTDDYLPILDKKKTGCFEVPMIHSSVLINLRRRESRLLTFIPDKLENYEGPEDDIIVFAMSASFHKIPLHVCNLNDYGYVMLPLEENQELEADLPNLVNLKMQIVADWKPLPYEQDLKQYLMQEPLKDKLDVDNIYFVNLERRPDRRIKMEHCFDQLGIERQLVEAVDGKLLDEEYLKRKGIEMLPIFKEPFHGRPLTFGEIGCFMSHYGIWQDMVKNHFSKAIIFEDDIRFEPNFRDHLYRLYRELESLTLEWDLVFLGRKILHNATEPWVDGSNLLVHVDYTYWTLAYMLSLEGANKLLAAEPLGKMLPVDEFLPIMYNRHPRKDWKEFFPERNLRAFSVHPLLVQPTHYTGENGYFSDTEDTPTIANKEESQIEKSEL